MGMEKRNPQYCWRREKRFDPPQGTERAETGSGPPRLTISVVETTPDVVQKPKRPQIGCSEKPPLLAALPCCPAQSPEWGGRRASGARGSHNRPPRSRPNRKPRWGQKPTHSIQEILDGFATLRACKIVFSSHCTDSSSSEVGRRVGGHRPGIAGP